MCFVPIHWVCHMERIHFLMKKSTYSTLTHKHIIENLLKRKTSLDKSFHPLFHPYNPIYQVAPWVWRVLSSFSLISYQILFQDISICSCCREVMSCNENVQLWVKKVIAQLEIVRWPLPGLLPTLRHSSSLVAVNTMAVCPCFISQTSSSISIRQIKTLILATPELSFPKGQTVFGHLQTAGYYNPANSIVFGNHVVFDEP